MPKKGISKVSAVKETGKTPLKVSTPAREGAKSSIDGSLAARIFDDSHQGIVVTDEFTNIINLNESFLKMSGYERGEIVSRKARVLFSRNNEKSFFKEMMEAVLANGGWQGEVLGKRKGADPYPAWLSINAFTDSNGQITHYAGICSDMSAVKQNELRLEHMAHFDPLTGMPNRSLMYDRLKQALNLAKRHRYNVAVMLLDLDRFKEVNDTLGHHIGDQLLTEASTRLLRCVRESDTIARMGGDEFLAILPEIGSANNAAHVAQKFNEVMALPFQLDGHEVFVSASIGITIYPNDGEEIDMLIKNADTAMYHAKAQGKNNSKFFTEDINKSTVERFKLESNFRRAIEKLEFHLNYQPKVDIKTGRMTGMEALLRWYHPSQGSINPGLFIPLAEETGLVVQLGEWALKEACRQNKAWQDEGLPPMKVAVNISARHFHRKDLADLISGVLKETGLEPRYLMIEITESTIIQNIEETIMLLKQIRDMGIGISIDDFGTGYSSLNYLNRFSIDELKIDRSFVADSVHEDNRKVINAIIALAHNLSLKVVAEGVETVEQLEYLSSIQCDLLQGYLFSKPLSSEDFRQLMEKGASFHDKLPADGTAGSIK